MHRKTNAFEGLDSDLRKKLAAYFLRCRAKDRLELDSREGWMDQSRSLEEYCRRLGVLKNYLLLRLQTAEGGKATVLDVGMGTGEALGEFSRRLNQEVAASGIRLTYRKLPDLCLEKIYVGPVETLHLPVRSVDLILSCRGGMAYSLNGFSSAEAVLNALKEGALSLIEDPRLIFSQVWFRDFLSRRGWEVEITRYQEGSPAAYKILRNTAAPLDLASFSRRYLELLAEHRDVFLKWGFDRLEKDSPLNALFQEIYSLRHYEACLD